ncbi:MAG: hypothetical protein VB050_03490 [Geobacteraceae bacterium]|nr:hypothetical protein [Geobacteraceae bacterium]
MRIFQNVIAALCLTLLTGYAVTGWSTELTDPVKAAYTALGDEAIVTKIESGTVTLQSVGDSSKEYQLAAKYVENARVGDRVKIDNNGVRKIDQPSVTDPGNSVKKEPQSVEQPASTLDQNPKPGTHP